MSDSVTDADQVPAERNTPGSGENTANFPMISVDDFPNEVLARILDHVPFLNYILYWHDQLFSHASQAMLN